MSEAAPNVIRTAGVMHSAMWNVIGRLAPVAVTLLVIPPLIALLGTARWGIMTIALTLVGSFGIFDLGLGRALTRAIAEDIAHGREHESADLALTGMLTLGGLGVLAAFVSAGLTGLYVDHGLRISSGLRIETRDAIWILCATAPLVLVNAALWGVISAFHQFRAANLINIPINIFYYVGPLLALHLWNSLCAVMLALAACRFTMTIGYAAIALRVMPSLRRARAHFSLLAPLWKIGGWMTASNITYPILSYCDRFLIGAMVPAAAIAYYTTPLDVIGRFSIVTLAITGSAFPSFARSFRVDEANTRDIFTHSALTIAGILFPVCFATAMLSAPLLTLWLGAGFAAHGAMIASLLCCGVLLSGLDSLAAGLLDAIGRPDLNAKFSMVELVIYLPLLALQLHLFGLVGAATAWVLRCTLDCVLRMEIAGRCYTPVAPAVRRLRRLVFLVLVFFGAVFIPRDTLTALGLAATGISLFTLIFWGMVLDSRDRTQLASRIGVFLRR
ncbi:flippase [Acidomonas methanolica]|uniref:flippase n=1 Tax=Acidomonas methanolica TaxID=437 RepID=UPI00211A8053|nr:flippase [Acidomonas methanolica]MCQ9156503.1 flippase [Acidomonas methanolica]